MLLSLWLHNNVCNGMGATELMLRSYFRQPAWWLGPTLARAFHTSPAEMPARHSERAAPPTASLMTSAACKTPGSGAVDTGGEEREKDRTRRGVEGDRERMTGPSALFSVVDSWKKYFTWHCTKLSPWGIMLMLHSVSVIKWWIMDSYLQTGGVLFPDYSTHYYINYLLLQYTLFYCHFYYF